MMLQRCHHHYKCRTTKQELSFLYRNPIKEEKNKQGLTQLGKEDNYNKASIPTLNLKDKCSPKNGSRLKKKKKSKEIYAS